MTAQISDVVVRPRPRGSRPLLLPLFALALAVGGCSGKGPGTGPSQLPGAGSGGPPAGVTQWSFTYGAATVFTCPAQTPDAGVAVMVVAPGGNSLTLSSPNLPSIQFDNDGTGRFVWQDGDAGIFFRFTTSRRVEGEAHGKLGVCSATWPFRMDQQ